ncbi:MAG: hypothetical protein ACRYGM_12340 [Janthinobacterium lividum]
MMRRDTVSGAGTSRPGHPRATTASRAALGVLLAALALAPAARADAVAAPSDAAALALEQRSSKGCSVDGFHTVFRGTLPGAAVPVTIATFAVEGCGGGSFGVFSAQGGTVVEWPQSPAPAGRVSEVVVQGDRLVVRWMTFRPVDPMCCPSEPHRAAYRLSGGRVILTR